MAYCARTDIEAHYGVESVAAWADLDNDADADKILARITLAIANADAEINDTLRGGPYVIPIAGDIPATITRVAVMLAGYDLYSPRGSEDFGGSGEPLHKLSGERTEARDILARLLAGQLRLDLTQHTTYPEVVTDDE